MADLKSNHQMAQVLLERYGGDAAREATRRELEALQIGHKVEAADWRRIRDILLEKASPSQT